MAPTTMGVGARRGTGRHRAALTRGSRVARAGHTSARLAAVHLKVFEQRWIVGVPVRRWWQAGVADRYVGVCDGAPHCDFRRRCGHRVYRPRPVRVRRDRDLAAAERRRSGGRHLCSARPASTTATMVLGGPGNPVLSAVQRSVATGNTTACSDQAQDGDGFFTEPVSGARVTIGLRGADQAAAGHPLRGTPGR